MKICVLFFNIGGYHVARLEAARRACESRHWTLSAIQVAGSTSEHPWGNFQLGDYIHTLLDRYEGNDFSLGDCRPLIEMLDSLNPDVVVIPGWGFDFSRSALAWARRNKRRTILMSESKEDDAPRAWWKEFIKSHRYVKRFDAALVGGAKHRDYLQRLGMDESRIFGGYDTVDNHYFVDEVDRLRSKTLPADVPKCVRGRKYFLTANRFIPRKNLITLVNAFGHLTKQGGMPGEWDLVLLGDGPQKADLQRIVKQRHLENRIHFPGFRSYREICNWYAFADVFIHPASSEQWGLVVNEAMAAGLPILISKACGCFPDLLQEGLNGFSFAPDNFEELAAQMRRLAGDRDLCSRMGVASREHIQENYSPRHFGEGLVAAADAIVQSIGARQKLSV